MKRFFFLILGISIFITARPQLSDKSLTISEQHEFFKLIPSTWDEFKTFLESEESQSTHTNEVFDKLTKLSAINDTIFCIKLMNIAITADYGVDGANYFQDVLHRKMGCTTCLKNKDKDMLNVMLWVISKIMKGDQMRFWQFYWASLSHEEDGGVIDSSHKKEKDRVLSAMDKFYPEMKRTASIAYEYFSNGVMFEDWYPYREEYIKTVKPYKLRHKQ